MGAPQYGTVAKDIGERHIASLAGLRQRLAELDELVDEVVVAAESSLPQAELGPEF
jgi:hypothetical protein